LTARRTLAAALPILASLAVLVPPATAGGRVITGTVPQAGLNVVLRAAPDGVSPEFFGRDRSDENGEFKIHYRAGPPSAVKYLVAMGPGADAGAGIPVRRSAYRLGAAIGTGPVPRRAVVDERSTVAMAFAMAQFFARGFVLGPEPGLRNAAAMSADLARIKGGISPVLRQFPNGSATSTLPTFGSLANLVALCRRPDRRCAALLRAARVPGRGRAANTLEAMVDIARFPWHNAAALFDLSLHAGAPYAPALARGEAPDAWTLALRFGADPPGLDGPGNFAIDSGGNLWVADNYEYSRRSRRPACGSKEVFRFTPTGRTYPGSPYSGGGLSGVGFGVTIDPSDNVWLGNFGFEGEGCEIEANHYSVSKFTVSGEVRSPERGYEVGGISWPQGTVSDQAGNIWLANCGNNSVTKIPGGDPAAAVNFSQAQIADGGVGFARPFGVAVDGGGHVFVTANASASVAELGPEGEVLRLISGGGLHRPLGVAVDSQDNVWVSNSTWVVTPCVGEFHQQGKGGGTVTRITSAGELAAGDPISGGGLRNPWGIAVDGADNVWVANFGGRRLSELCGARPSHCPAGKRRTGDAISPEETGYGFDGLVRNTGVAIDPSGNVWLANNWKSAPIQTNPGGYQIVAFLGLAAPVRAPQIGPPERP
jgi:sugar lactone lactonase YvrE